jgi:hypothetical protein
MDLKLNITSDVETDDDHLDRQILDIVEEEALKFVAALTDRLEAEGIENVKVRLL